MAVKLETSDPAFDGAFTLERRELDDLIAWTRGQLGLGDNQPWQVVSSLSKLSKSLFEIEDSSGRRLIGKVSKSKRASETWARMRMLWDAGMRPPAPYRIPEPIAWLPERHLLVQERARGQQLREIITQKPQHAIEFAAQAAGWLHALRAAPLPHLPQAASLEAVVERCRRELTEVAPHCAARFRQILDEVMEVTDLSAEQMVPSHGDFHPMNVYVADGGVVTAIDLDTLALNEPAYDIAWFLAQTAIMGYHVHGRFDDTAGVRRAFSNASPEDPDRTRLLVRLALLRSLHYDLCILKLEDVPHFEPFLEAAESGALF